MSESTSEAGSRGGPPWRDVLVCALLALLVLLCFPDVVTGRGNFYRRDLAAYYYPMKQVVRSIVESGEFPYWNRFMSGGQPIAANPEHEVFYPLTWLILLPDFDLGFRLLVLLHVWIGMAAMYALLLSFALTRTSSVFGAISWGLGGVYLSYVNLLPILLSAAWTPLVLLYARRFHRERRPADFALAGLFLGLQCLVGEPTTVLQTGILVGSYALYRAVQDRRPVLAAIRNVALTALLGVAGLAAGAAQILPAADHTGDSVRSLPFSLQVVSSWSMPWQRPLELLLPHAFGHFSHKSGFLYWGAGLYPDRGQPFLLSIYCGLLVSILATTGLAARVRGASLVAITTAVSFLMALGANTPLRRWTWEAGILRSIRYPEKFAMFGMLALVVFAAVVLDRVVRGDLRVRRVAFVVSVAVLLFAVVAAAFSHTGAFMPLMARWWAGWLAGNASATALIRSDMLAFVLRALVAVVLLVAAGRGKQTVWSAALLTFAYLDLRPIANDINPRMPRWFFDPVSVPSSLPADRSAYRVFHEVDFLPDPYPEKMRHMSSPAGPYWFWRNALFPFRTASAGVRTALERDVDETNLLPAKDLLACMAAVRKSGRPDWAEPFMAMSNAWFRIRLEPYDRTMLDAGPRGYEPVVFEPVARVPRYTFAEAVVPVRNPRDVARRLSSHRFPLRVAFVEGRSFPASPGIVHRVRETANTATIDVESSGQGFLMMSVTRHKYWRITVDGREVDPVPTNVAYQGIPIPAGRHQVLMRYRNPLVAAGSATSAVTVVLLLGIAFAGARRREDGSAGVERSPEHA